MPYIKQERRALLFPSTDVGAANPGELNFQLSVIVRLYMAAHVLNYQTINDIIGALESAKAEFQRRVVAPYEDQKLKENGDVYGA
jgi:hypothetical protein